MRRLFISILAAGLAAGTLFSAAGAASASGAAAHKRVGCHNEGVVFLHVTKSGVNYYVGTPNTTKAGATVRLKPRTNSTTQWTRCHVLNGEDEYVLFNRNLVMTSSGVPGSDVTVEHVGNFGSGTARQRWHADFSGDTVTLKNVKSGQFLRVRNSGPTMGQTVTTGFTATTWRR